MECQQVKAADIPALFKDNAVSYNKIDTVDWAAEFPYCPQVEFAIAHVGDAILLHYRVEEDSVRAEAGTRLRSGLARIHAVSSSAVLMKKGVIITLKATVSVRYCCAMDRDERIVLTAPAAALEQIDRWASLGREPFEMREGRQAWELALVVPVSSYFRHTLENLSGKT